MELTKINKYDNTSFYKIVCNDTNISDCYVGHTSNFKLRQSQHKHSCNTETNNRYDTNIYKFIRANGGWSNWTMLLIEKINCESCLEACKRERMYIDTLHATLNVQVSSRTKQEWDTTNKLKTVETQKRYYNTIYKDKFTVVSICLCGGKVSMSSKSNHVKSRKHQNFINA